MHVGKWIALKEAEVSAVCGSHDELLKEDEGVYATCVFYSITEPEKQYGFLFLVHKWKLPSEGFSAEILVDAL